MNVQTSQASRTSKRQTDKPRLGFDNQTRRWSRMLRAVERNWALWAGLMIVAMIAGSVF